MYKNITYESSTSEPNLERYGEICKTIETACDNGEYIKYIAKCLGEEKTKEWFPETKYNEYKKDNIWK